MSIGKDIRKAAVWVAFLLGGSISHGQTKLSTGLLGMMEARSIGPASTGGRITAIEAVSADPRIIYVGTAGGGIWKSTTGGTLFKPIFDKYNQSIGALAIDPKQPETIWAGTGESNMRNSVSVGDGLYKSTDGGENWTKLGLDSSEHISKIVIDPNNSDVVYVAVPGHLWDDHAQRGLYKTTDGGKTWKRILQPDAQTGCTDIVINPSDPKVLYAATWVFRRKGWSFRSGGKGSGVWKSTDAGATWQRIQKGLPEGELGRSCLAIAPTEPNKLLAIVESKETNLYLSDNGGASWELQSNNNNVSGRPFYFSVIAFDPKNPKRVYRPAWSLSISDDGGRSFKEASFEGGWVHSDHHALWIDPNNTNRMLLGTDGGVYQSVDKGNNWDFLANLPVAQFYHVSIDRQTPYHVYGGLQDNGSWTAPSQKNGGIKNGDWANCGGGDGFWVQPSRQNPKIIFSESQGGNMSRVNMETNESVDIQPYPMAGEKKFRFNWNTPIVLSPDGKRMYAGAQYLFRSTNQGNSWDRISPDLTTNDPIKQKQEESGGVTVDNSSAENHCTIFTIAESPIDNQQLWVGTDDGNLQLSTDGGVSWKKVNPPTNAIPAQTWVSSITPSYYNKNRVYATFDRHMEGDVQPYIAMSEDLGKTWVKLGGGDVKGYAHKLLEDRLNENLLFAGTEFGLFCSIDRGKSWAQMSAKIPPVAVRDIQLDSASSDLVLATHGRGILIVDNISPIRQLTPELMDKSVAIFESPKTVVRNGRYGGSWGLAGEFVGPNSTEDARIYYYLKDRVTSGNLKVRVLGQDGKLIEELSGTKRKGINVVNWNMRLKPPRVASGARLNFGGFTSMLAPPGVYTVEIKKGEETITGTIQLINDPKSAHSAEDEATQRKTCTQLYALQESLAYLCERNKNLQDSLQAAAQSLPKAKKSLSAAAEKLEAHRKTLIATKEGQGVIGEEQLGEKLSMIFAALVYTDGRPTDSQLLRAEALGKDLELALAEQERLEKEILPGARKASSRPLVPFSRAAFDASKK